MRATTPAPTDRRMKVLITGATGFIGSRVTQRLADPDRGHDVAALVRGDPPHDLPDGVRTVRGDLAAPSQLTPLAAQFDAVVHLGAVPGPDLPAADHAAAEALLGGLPAGGTFVYTSGAAVPGDTGDGVGDETTPTDPSAPMAWRGRTETAVLGARPDVRRVVVRPSVLVYGAGGGLATRMLRAAAEQGAVAYPEDGSARLSTVRVEDLADVYVRTVEDPSAQGVFIGASDESVVVGDLAAAIADLSGAAVRPLPAAQAREQMGMLATLLSSNVVVSGARARRELGWRPSGSLLDDVRRPAPWVTDALAAPAQPGPDAPRPRRA